MSKTYRHKGGDDYGLRKGREKAREGRKERRKEGEISQHRQAMADALEVVHLQNVGMWHR